MPKLLMVTTVASTLRAFLLPYARHFRKRGWMVGAMSNGVKDCPECAKEFNHCHEISFRRNPFDLKNFKGTGGEIRARVLEGGYDIVHVHTPVAALLTRFALRKEPRRPKIVYTAHGFHFFKGVGSNFWKNIVYVGVERIARPWTDHTVVINRADYDLAVAAKIAEKGRLSLFPGIGLDFSLYSRENVDVSAIKNVRADLMLEKNDEIFLMVGEFNPGKRHRDALAALAATGRKNFHLVFAGTGPLEDSMKQLAFQMGLVTRTHFLGQRTDVPLLMLSARATVLPSEREGLNRSVMESICLGIPVLGADARGIRDLITDPSRGALFPVGKPASLAASMILAVDDPCPEKPKPDPLWKIENLLREHDALYDKLLGSAE
jgi:glycosyltransferase involved in cell wall biosynthesis